MRVAVIGSGPAGTAAAQSLLDGGCEVEMLDGGHQPEPTSDQLAAAIRVAVEAGAAPDREIRRELRQGPGAAAPGSALKGLLAVLSGGVEANRIEKRILGSTFTFEGVEEGIPLASETIPRSLARGGLSNVWGAACYAWREDDYAHWPIGREDLAPHYAAAAELFGLVQEADDLERAYPLHGPVESTPPRNPGSAAETLLAHWSGRERELSRHGFAVGRARVASRPIGSQGDACRRCGLCVYGCAWSSIYSTRRTLPALERRGMPYRAGLRVERFHETPAGVRVCWRDATGPGESTYDAVFLAAGTLSSLRIAADSLGEHDRPVRLLDNDMLLLPLLLTRGWVGGAFRTRFTLAEATLALEAKRVSERPVHLQLYSFHEYFLAELGPVVDSLPGPARRPVWSLLNNLLVSFTYTAGSESRIAAGRVRRGAPIGSIEIEQRLHPEQRGVHRRLMRHLWRARRATGFVPLSPLAKLAPLGFSGHLAGSLPMRRDPGPLESHVDGRLHGTQRVYVVDGASFPDLPAQNLTYSIAANAMRIAARFAARAAA